jgi:hypothetical protein
LECGDLSPLSKALTSQRTPNEMTRYRIEILKVKFAAAPFLLAADRIMNTRIT